ncbi:MAG: Multicopper oxidase [Chloroflexi bacterium]|nr:Multicopper oxidase [Chloroflexota bacterium]
MDTEVNNTHGAPPGDVGPAPARRRGPVHRASAGLRRVWWLLPAIAAAVTAGVHIPVSASNLVLAHPSEGLICTEGATKTVGTTTTRSYLLTARDGYITTPDGNSIYMWSYANGDQGFQYPGPFLCANEGDQVSVTLRNSLPLLVNQVTHLKDVPVPTSIIFTGVPGVKVDGALSQPETATGSLSKAAAPGGTVTYTFTAGHPGTFTYESGTDPQLQVQMGMVGGLVVRPSTACTATTHCRNAYDNTFSRYDSAHEYVHLLSEVDPDLHHWVEIGHGTFDWSKYIARYYMINGRSFPDTIAPNGVSNLPGQPYGSLVHVQPRNTDSASADFNPDPSLVRYINAGPVAYPFHPHSNHESTVGVDGHELVTATNADASIERFDTNVAPGQTVDSLFTWVDAQNWQPNNGTSDPGNPVQVPVPSQQDRFEGPYWNGTPYLGDLKPVATGLTRYNECGEFYHVAHSHALFQVTNFGFSGGGMLTMVRVDPPPSLQNKNGVTCTVPGK